MTKLKKILITCGSIILVIALALSIWFFGATYPDFNAKESFEIPGLSVGFVPKGICRLGTDVYGWWLISGYMKDGSPSRIYLVDQNGQIKRYVTVKNAGTTITGEFGGIASSGESIWLVSEGTVYYMLATDLLQVADTKAVQILDKFDTTIDADFCFANENVFIVGESKGVNDGSRQTLEKDGEKHTAYAFVFEVGNGKYGFNSDNLGRIAPSSVYSIPDGVRGVCAYDSKLVLSVNHGKSHGELLLYDDTLSGSISNVGTISVMNTTLSIKGLWQDKAVKSVKTLPCGEGLEYVNREIYSLYSSASKDGGFSRTREKFVLSFTL